MSDNHSRKRVLQSLRLACSKPAVKQADARTLREYEALRGLPLTAASTAFESGVVCFELAHLLYVVGVYESLRQQGDQATACLLRARTLFGRLGQRIPFATVVTELGNQDFTQGRLQSAESNYEKAIDVLQASRDGEVQLARALRGLALVKEATGKWAEAEMLFGDAMVKFKTHAAFTEQHQDVYLSCGDLGKLYRLMGRFRESGELLADSVAHLSIKTSPLLAVSCIETLANALFGDGRFREACQLYDIAGRVLKHVLSDRHPALAMVLANHAAATLSYGDHSASERLLREALRVQRLCFGDQHPTVAHTLNIRGALLAETTELASAMADYELADSIVSPLSEHTLLLAQIRYNRGECLRRMKRPQEAAWQFDSAFALCVDSLGVAHPYTSQVQCGLAAALHELGDLERAEKLFEQALAKYPKDAKFGRSEHAVALNNYGILLASQGKLDQADAMFSEGLDIKLSALNPTHGAIALGYYNRANVARAAGRRADAESLYLASKRLVLGCPPLPDSLSEQILHEVAKFYKSIGDEHQSLQCWSELIDFHVSAYGVDHPIALNSLSQWARHSLQSGQYEPVLSRLVQYARQLAAIDEWHRSLADIWLDVGAIYGSQGQPRHSISACLRALKICRKHVCRDHRDYVATLHRLAEEYFVLNRVRRAERLFRINRDNYRAAYGDPPVAFASYLNRMGSVYLALGQYTDAADHFTQAREIYRDYEQQSPASLEFIESNLRLALERIASSSAGQR